MTKQLTFYILLFLLIGCSQSDPSNQPDSTVPDSRYQTRPLLIGESVPVPAVFVTDPSGSILFKYVNPDYKERINGEILLAALRSFAE
ncbi:MAG: hypothetical protein WD035_12225 [Balneolaceae bacterium]